VEKKLRGGEYKHYSHRNYVREVGNKHGRRMENEKEEEEACRTVHKEEHPYCSSIGARRGA
jgi:hypothetical protein